MMYRCRRFQSVLASQEGRRWRKKRWQTTTEHNSPSFIFLRVTFIQYSNGDTGSGGAVYTAEEGSKRRHAHCEKGLGGAEQSAR